MYRNVCMWYNSYILYLNIYEHNYNKINCIFNYLFPFLIFCLFFAIASVWYIFTWLTFSLLIFTFKIKYRIKEINKEMHLLFYFIKFFLFFLHTVYILQKKTEKYWKKILTEKETLTSFSNELLYSHLFLNVFFFFNVQKKHLKNI